MNDGTCVDGPNSFTCECPNGFRGTYCHLRDYDDVCPLGACSGRQCVDNYLTETKYCQCYPGSRYGLFLTDILFGLTHVILSRHHNLVESDKVSG